jgi:hypothetical protein
MDSYTITPLTKNLEPWGVYKNEIIGINKDYNIVIGKDMLVLPFQQASPTYPSYFKPPVLNTNPLHVKMSFHDNSNVICVWVETIDSIEWCIIKDRKLVTQQKVSVKLPPNSATGLYNGMFGIYGKGVWEYDKILQDSFNFYLDGLMPDGRMVYHDENIIYRGNEVYYQSAPIVSMTATKKSNYGNVLVDGDVIAFVLTENGNVYVGTTLLPEKAKEIENFNGDYIMLDKKLYNYKTSKFLDNYLVPAPESKDKLVMKNNVLYRGFNGTVCKIEKNDRISTFQSYLL